MDKYKLVIFGDDWDVYQAAYHELICNPEVLYIQTFRPSGLKGLIQRIQFNPRLNGFLNMPLKSMWNPYYVRDVKCEKVCFLILERWLRMECGIKLLPFLKKRYPKSRIVCFTQDLVETIKDHYSHEQIDVNYIKQYVDLFISYDISDAKKHNLSYHPTVFSPISSEYLGKEVKPKYDLYFLGRDKGRLDMLVKICKEATQKGLQCKFLLVDVPKEKKIYSKGLEYVDGKVSYIENLRNCAMSKCIIELLQNNASSPTFRTWEAIALNKKLMTNNTSIALSEIYDENYISMFCDEKDFNWNFVKEENKWTEQEENPFLNRIRPESLICFIENKLNIQIIR